MLPSQEISRVADDLRRQLLAGRDRQVYGWWTRFAREAGEHPISLQQFAEGRRNFSPEKLDAIAQVLSQAWVKEILKKE